MEGRKGGMGKEGKGNGKGREWSGGEEGRERRGRREGKGWQGNGRNGNWGGSLRHGLWGGWTPLYMRMIRKLLEGCENTYNYIDDVISYSKSWESHLEITRKFLERVKEANLALRPSKVYIGYDTLNFLDHTIRVILLCQELIQFRRF
jgi:hypothetical protein